MRDNEKWFSSIHFLVFNFYMNYSHEAICFLILVNMVKATENVMIVLTKIRKSFVDGVGGS